jgi:hypothetical protein
MKAKEKSEREIGGQVKVFPYNFLYSCENFPPQIPVTFTVQLKPLLLKVSLLRNLDEFFRIHTLSFAGSTLSIRAFRPITPR